MSTLLEEAIVDAKALREAAMKTAEKSIIEKYSDEVKKGIDAILEAEVGMDNAASMNPIDNMPNGFQVIGGNDWPIQNCIVCFRTQHELDLHLRQIRQSVLPVLNPFECLQSISLKGFIHVTM